MSFQEGQFYMVEIPEKTASDAVGRNMAHSSCRNAYKASPTFEGNPAMITVLIPQSALEEVSQIIRDALGGSQ